LPQSEFDQGEIHGRDVAFSGQSLEFREYCFRILSAAGPGIGMSQRTQDVRAAFSESVGFFEGRNSLIELSLLLQGKPGICCNFEKSRPIGRVDRTLSHAATSNSLLMN
jgi:hypothetical protein